MDIDPRLLLAIGAALALLALYFLFARQDATMWGFLCIIGVIVVGILYYYPDAVHRTFG